MTTCALLQSPAELQLNKRSPSSSPPNATRPKLSLNTATHRTYGRSSTGLRVDSLSEASPTVQNTYRNTYQSQSETWHESPCSGYATSKTLGPIESHDDVLSFQGHQLSHADDPLGENHQPTLKAPYTIPSEVSSILVNGPLARRLRSSGGTPSSTQQASHPKKSARPRQRRVCFREPLSEEISTKTFIFKHSDIRSRSSSPASKSGRSRKTNLRAASRGSPPPLKSRKSVSETSDTLKTTQDQDSASTSSAEDGEEDVRGPKTPVAGRPKKERQWVWTLGPLPGANGPGSVAQMDNSSEEDLDQSLGESVSAASAFSS